MGSGISPLNAATGLILKGGLTASSTEYLTGKTLEAKQQLYRDFDNLFLDGVTPGTDDATKLDITMLFGKYSMDEALIDCLMYDDDVLVESALELLTSNVR